MKRFESEVCRYDRSEFDAARDFACFPPPEKTKSRVLTAILDLPLNAPEIPNADDRDKVNLLPPRYRRVRASSIGAIWRGEIDSYARIISAWDWGVEFENPVADNPNERMIIGKNIESGIVAAMLERYAPELRGWEFVEFPKNEVLDMSEYRICGAMDGQIYERGSNNFKVVEVKNTAQYWKTADDIPLDYILQCHVYMLLSGCQHAEIWSLHGGSMLKRWPVTRSATIISEILRRTATFLDGERPTADELTEAKRVNKDELVKLAIDSKASKTVAAANNETALYATAGKYVGAMERAAELKRQAREVEDEAATDKAKIFERMGDAEYLELPATGISFKKTTTEIPERTVKAHRRVSLTVKHDQKGDENDNN